jgi:hypothetical protein
MYPLADSRKLTDCIGEELFHPPSGSHRPLRGHHQGDIGPVVTDRVEPHQSTLSEMKLGGGSHSWHTRDMSYEGHPPGPPVSAAPDPARHDGAESIGANGEPCPNGVSLPRLVTDDGAGNRVPFVQQLLDPGPLGHHRSGAAGGSDQLVIEDSAGD